MHKGDTNVLILGGLGMLGHTLYKTLKPDYPLKVSVRGSVESISHFGIFDKSDVIEGIDAFDFGTIIRAYAIARPTIVINAIGLIKQLPSSHDSINAITINSLLPHRLASLSAATGSRLIHISTDCVFSGEKGNYSDDDQSDAKDLYGRSKYLGEVGYDNCVTLRTSIIGRELKTKVGLLEWFLSTRDTVQGYKKAIYTGFTTTELSKIIAEHIIPNQPISGVYNVSSTKISKFDLLQLISKVYNHHVTVLPNTDFVCDRSLTSERFQKLTGYKPPSWHSMINEMFNNN